MAQVVVEDLSFAYPGSPAVVDGAGFALAPGELFCLLGPSGCGKSTLLRLIAGHLKPASGRVRIGGRDLTDQPPERRDIGMVFQNYALFPHLSALDNAAFALRVRGVKRAERRARARKMLAWTGLTPGEFDRPPASLSGGQQQRVALARALVSEPVLLMLDEPFANLDRILRERLREEMRRVLREAGATAILVTHDRDEAFAVADRIAVMQAGRLVQTGAPREVHERPASPFVAEFLGHRNLLHVTRVDDDGLEADGARFPVAGLKAAPGDHLLVRPGAVELHTSSANGRLPGTVTTTRFTGGDSIVTVAIEGGPVVEIRCPEGRRPPSPGDAAWLSIPRSAVTVVPGTTGAPEIIVPRSVVRGSDVPETDAAGAVAVEGKEGGA